MYSYDIHPPAEVSAMGTSERRVEVCKCENCGNEAEMTVTCEIVTLISETEDGKEKENKQEKKKFTCINCGNEADMIIDL
jgi:hypothetical protein